jgi:hypothetical protein
MRKLGTKNTAELVQGYGPMSGGCVQGIDEAALPILLQQRGRQPGGLVAVDEHAELGVLFCEPYILFGRTGPLVEKPPIRAILPQICGTPPVPGRHDMDLKRRGDGEVARRCGDPVGKRAPDALCLLLVKTLERHGCGERVVGSKSYTLAPVWIEQVVAVKADEPANQPAVCVPAG